MSCLQESSLVNESFRVPTMSGNFKKVDVLTGPFDPGGQPETRIGQPLELGFFAWNIKGGMTASKAVLSDPQRLQNYWEWPNSMRLVQLAEEVGFDYQVPFGRWLGQGGATDYNGAALDFLASAAATAPITKRLGLFSTAHITYRFHPLHIAKFGATIDHISGGRWGLNIVSGYSEREMAAFGFKQPIGHDQAYDMADEFVCLMKDLWSETERFDFEGKYYQAYGALVVPRPTRNPRPVLMNAALSDKGIDFGVRHCDWVFTEMPTLEGYRERTNYIHNLAAKYGRHVRVATMCWVVAAPTDQEAQATYEWIEAEIDHEAVLNFINSLSSTREARLAGKTTGKEPWGGVGKERYIRIALGIMSPQIVGSYQTVAEKLRALHETGLESLLICFFDPQKGLHQMQDDVIPILKKMGLRK
jgi:FMNH2-dependent dimethyl sulfone monooxygenase